MILVINMESLSSSVTEHSHKEELQQRDESLKSPASKTRTLPYSAEAVDEAAEVLSQGKLVSFPTETVYGLGALALSAEACTSIFTTKGRPLTDPLIVHVHSLDQAIGLIDQGSQATVSLFKTLAGKYWPGPLTMVVKANLDVIPSLITAETGYVGIRMPNHEIALDILRKFDKPIAAPSANKFGHVSPTKAEHVYKDFHKDSEVLIIDGGSCSFGIESTVLKLIESSEGHFDALILRKGGVSKEHLQTTLEELDLSGKVSLSQVAPKHSKPETEQLEGPGQFLRHYSPDIVSYLFTGEDAISRSDIKLQEAVLLDFSKTFAHLKGGVKYYHDLSPDGDFLEAINKVYDILRWAETNQDASCVLIINILDLFQARTCDTQSHKGSEHMEALFDRLFRATSGQSA